MVLLQSPTGDWSSKAGKVSVCLVFCEMSSNLTCKQGLYLIQVDSCLCCSAFRTEVSRHGWTSHTQTRREWDEVAMVRVILTSP